MRNSLWRRAPACCPTRFTHGRIGAVLGRVVVVCHRRDGARAVSNVCTKSGWRRKLGKGGKFCRPGVLIGNITMPTFVVSELTARSAARPVGDVGDTPGHFYA